MWKDCLRKSWATSLNALATSLAMFWDVLGPSPKIAGDVAEGVSDVAGDIMGWVGSPLWTSWATSPEALVTSLAMYLHGFGALYEHHGRCHGRH